MKQSVNNDGMISISFVDVSLAVPLTNSLTFVVTTLTGHLLGEKISKGNLNNRRSLIRDSF